MDDLDPSLRQKLFPALALGGRDAQGDEVETGMRIAEGRLGPFGVARFEREKLLACAGGEPDGSFASATVVPRPPADHRKPEDVDVEPLRAREILHLDGDMMEAPQRRHAGTIAVRAPWFALLLCVRRAM